MDDLVSILIPVYNGENYIERCMNSILNQTYKNYEVIIVNDGSTDQSEQIIKRYLGSDYKIRYFSQANRGAASARNKGIREARGKWIFFVDIDDWIDCNTLEICIDEIQKYFLDGIIFQHKYEFVNYSEDSALMFPNKVCDGIAFMEQSIRKKFLYIQPWKGIFKKAVILREHIYFTDGLLCEDEEWLPKVLVNMRAVEELPVALYHHCVVEGSLGNRNKNHKKIHDMLYIEKKLTRYYELHVCDKKARCVLKDYAVRKYMGLSLDNKIDARYVRKIVKVRWMVLNSYFIKTKICVSIFSVSPLLYKKLVLYIKNRRAK